VSEVVAVNKSISKEIKLHVKSSAAASQEVVCNFLGASVICLRIEE
jgi:hypothetical protein